MIGEETGRKSKKRKYVMVGEDWGTVTGNKEQGLELLIEDWKAQDAESSNNKDGTSPILVEEVEAAPLFPLTGNSEKAKNTTGSEEEIGPLLDLKTKNSSSNGEITKDQEGWEIPSPLWKEPNHNEADERGNKIDPINTQECKDGTGPLQGNIESRNTTVEEIMINSDGGASQVENNLQEPQEGNSNQDNNVEQLLYNTASNIMRLREAQGECEILRGYCKVHRVKAVRNTRSERIWTRVKKTGLFGWRTRKLSVLRCPNSVATLVLRCPNSVTNQVGTMSSRDGAGVT